MTLISAMDSSKISPC